MADVDINVAEAPAPAPEPAPAPAPAPAAAAAEAPAGIAPLPTNYGDIQPVADVAEAADLNVVFIDGRADEGGIALATDSVTYGMPDVVTRAGWRANETLRCQGTTYDSEVQAAGVHHTAGSNNYSRAESAGIVRGIYDYHARSLGWCDVGYNALVDKYGTIYEGRFGGLDKNVQGAHVGGFNRNTFGISMMGNYDVAQTTPAMIQSVGEMIGWKAAVAGFDPQGSAPYTPLAFNGSKYTGGRSMTLPNVFAHRDAHNNACPGTYGYAQMGNIKTIAAQKVQEIESGSAGASTTSTPSTTSAPSTTSTPSTTATTPPPAEGNTRTETTTTLQEPVGQESPAQQDSATALLSSAANGEQTALLTIIGSLAALAVTYLAAEGASPGTTAQVGDVQILEGVTLDNLKPVLDIASSLAGDTKVTQAVDRVNTNYGAVLGEPRGGLNTADATYALFDNGIVLDESGSAEARALWGAIGDVWAGQGFDLGPLGMPLNEQYSEGDLVRVDFEGGYVTFDPATGDVDVKLS